MVTEVKLLCYIYTSSCNEVTTNVSYQIMMFDDPLASPEQPLPSSVVADARTLPSSSIINRFGSEG
jgi:hypothetical protein